MLHELIFALSGHPGSVFVLNESKEIKVVPELPFLSPAEEQLLNQLCRLGTRYYHFHQFIRTHSCCPALVPKKSPDEAPTFSTGLKPGLYLTALCDGLNKVLEPYREVLLEIEKEVLADPHLTIMHLQSCLEEFKHLFASLATVLDQIISQKAHGCQILDILHKASLIGLPLVRCALQRMINVCQSVLYRQLSGWMLHGFLLDKHKEFFIHHEPPPPSVPPVVEEDELGLGGITGRQLQQMLQISGPHSMATHEEFSIRGDLLPCYVPVRVAEKILFVGESVHMFESQRKNDNFKTKNSILKNEEEQFARALHLLSMDDEFTLRNFEEVIDDIRKCVAGHLWSLVVEEYHLIGELKIIKEFFLLGRGELFLAFIDKVSRLLEPPPVPSTAHDVNVAFRQAARNVLLEDDTLLLRLQLTIDPAKIISKKSKLESTQGIDKGDSPIETGWSALGLSYQVEWPLHILLTQGTLEKYNSLFRFLLALKRVQLELQNCWAVQQEQKSNPKCEKEAIKWLLRYHMAFLIDTLQYYLQVDVIESQFCILIDNINSTKDFETIRHAHEKFLAKLLAQSFLHMKPIANCLNKILTLCHRFCALTSSANTGKLRSISVETEQLDHIARDFQRLSSLLFRVLSSVRNHQASPHLAQLLLRMDFNKYFSMAGGQLGSYTTVQEGKLQTPTSSRN